MQDSDFGSEIDIDAYDSCDADDSSDADVSSDGVEAIPIASSRPAQARSISNANFPRSVTSNHPNKPDYSNGSNQEVWDSSDDSDEGMYSPVYYAYS